MWVELVKPVWCTFLRKEINMENQFTVAAYLTFLNEHRLMASKDIKSNAIFLPPRPLNPANYSTEMEWYELSGKAVLEGYTIVYIAPTAMLEAGFSRKNPYCVGVVRTEEGPMISALILGVDPFQPESIQIGTPLKVKFVDRGEGDSRKTFLAFEPA